VKGKAVEDSPEARQEVLLPAYRVTAYTDLNMSQTICDRERQAGRRRYFK
jgi:hypothetical protein